MKETHELPVAPIVTEIVEQLQNAGYETYVVGGAIRDLLMNHTPKDYDISSAATPEEIRAVFGRRNARIIGKRFRLVHLHEGGVIYEISTFRSAPKTGGHAGADENLITSDNEFGTSEEDAFRRDFTVNALFYDPVKKLLIDHTGKGIEDIKNGCVRAIGDAKLRFEEDPVRMLRALKLVAQYDFSLEAQTENALFSSLHLIEMASPSRLSLELEKILESSYGDRHLETFHDYGLLHYFLPAYCSAWGEKKIQYALDLLNLRNCRVSAGIYRNSVSLAMAILALPFVEEKLGRRPGELWEDSPESADAIRHVLETVFRPESMMNRMTDSAERVLRLQTLFESRSEKDRARLLASQSYLHARELRIIRSECANAGSGAEIEAAWPKIAARKRKRPPRKVRPGQGAR